MEHYFEIFYSGCTSYCCDCSAPRINELYRVTEERLEGFRILDSTLGFYYTGWRAADSCVAFFLPARERILPGTINT